MHRRLRKIHPRAPKATSAESVDTRARRVLDELEQTPAEGVSAYLGGRNAEMRIIDSPAVSPALRQELRDFLAQRHVDIVGNPTQ